MKAHLRDTHEPLHDGQTYLANCGQEVAQVRLVIVVDLEDIDFVTLSALSCCRECFKLSRLNGAADRTERYVFGFVKGGNHAGSLG